MPKEVQFYAYIIGGVLNIRWNVNTMQNKEICDVIRDYLNSLDLDKMTFSHILEEIKDKSRNQIKQETKRILPSLFVGRTAWPTLLPKETPTVKVNLEFIHQLKERIAQSQKEEPIMESQNQVNNDTTLNEKAPRFHLPAGVNPDQLTPDNFRSLVGRRFRVTTEQQNRIKAGTLTRDQAFVEFIADLKKENQS